MASIEVGYQLRNAVSCLVASEDLVPSLSWPYDRILSQLRANPEISPPELARGIVDEYVGYYRERPPVANAGEVTKIALDPGRSGTARLRLPAAELRFLGLDLTPVFEPGEVDILVGPHADPACLVAARLLLRA